MASVARPRLPPQSRTFRLQPSRPRADRAGLDPRGGPDGLRHARQRDGGAAVLRAQRHGARHLLPGATAGGLFLRAGASGGGQARPSAVGGGGVRAALGAAPTLVAFLSFSLQAALAGAPSEDEWHTLPAKNKLPPERRQVRAARGAYGWGSAGLARAHAASLASSHLRASWRWRGRWGPSALAGEPTEGGRPPVGESLQCSPTAAAPATSTLARSGGTRVRV